MTQSNTEADSKQDSHQVATQDVFVIETDRVTYDAGVGSGRGRGRRHTFTCYTVRKNGRIVEDGLSRRQAASRCKAIRKSGALLTAPADM